MFLKSQLKVYKFRKYYHGQLKILNHLKVNDLIQITIDGGS